MCLSCPPVGAVCGGDEDAHSSASAPQQSARAALTDGRTDGWTKMQAEMCAALIKEASGKCGARGTVRVSV